MIRLWRLYQGSGFGPGHLPQRGGVLDQPVIMLEAFDLMSAAEAELKEKK